mgnify:CR=1 FL=1
MFEKEIDMQELLYKKYKNNPKNIILKEFNGRFGNVDIVKVKINNNNILNEQALLLSQQRYAFTVSFLHKNSKRTLDYLTKKTGYSRTIQLRILKKLISEKIVYKNENCYYLHKDFVYPKIIFDSYELKLRDWKKALSQAIKNLEFSTFSWVVLPKEVCDNLKQDTIKLYNEYGIGILSLNINGKTKIILKAKRNNNKRSNNSAYIVSINKFLIYQQQKYLLANC